MKKILIFVLMIFMLFAQTFGETTLSKRDGLIHEIKSRIREVGIDSEVGKKYVNAFLINKDNEEVLEHMLNSLDEEIKN